MQPGVAGQIEELFASDTQTGVGLKGEGRGRGEVPHGHCPTTRGPARLTPP